MKPWKRIVLIGASILVVLFVSIEILSRIADGQTDAQKMFRIANGTDTDSPGFLGKFSRAYLDPAAFKNEDARTLPHPYLGYVLKPSWHSAPGATQQFSHNSLGLRGKETTWKKPAGVFRVITLGGSSVYGQSESKDEAVWSVRLEGYLNAVSTPSHPIEVINGGCPGYTSYEMLANLAFRLVDLEPDVVIVYEGVNDMRAALYTAGAPEPAHDNTHWRSTWPVDRPSSLEKLLEHSRGYLFARRYFTNYVQERVDLGYYAMVNYDPKSNELYCGGKHGYPDGKVPEQGFVNYRRNLESIISIAEAHGAKVLLATQALMEWDFPIRECPEIQIASFRKIQNIEREVAKARGVALVETGAAIEAADKKQFESSGKHLFKNDVHPFDEGSDVIANIIARAFVEKRMFER